MVRAMSRARLFMIVLGAALLASGCENSGGGGASGGKVADLEGRVKKLETEAAKYREMLEMIHQNIERQKKEQEDEEANQPAPDAVFAVDITGNQVEGPPNGAYVTIIEAWDFA